MDLITVLFSLVAMLVLGVVGYSMGFDRGRTKGRLEVMAQQWRVEHPEPTPEPDPLAWLLAIDPREQPGKPRGTQ